MAQTVGRSSASAAQHSFLAAPAHRPGPTPLRSEAPDSHNSHAIAPSHVPASGPHAKPGNKSVSFDSHLRRHDNETRDMTWSTRSEQRRGRSPSGAGATTQADAAERYADERTRILDSGRGRIGDYAATNSANGLGAAAISSSGPAGLGKATSSVHGDASPRSKSGKTWWSQMLENFGSVELENKGSVARDHLALERTFLAWLRTSLSFASIGIAITQLFRLNTTIAKDGEKPDTTKHLRQVGKPLGSTFIAISVVVLFIGFHRYFESQHYVIRGKFPASRGSIVVIASSAGALIVSSLVVILAIGNREFET